MKKLIFLFLVIVFAASGCKNKKQAEYTVLGDYTPYGGYMEKLNGKVETAIETNYWAVPEGESYIKGEKMTIKELDSLGYTGDFEATFDEAGDIVSCTWIDENKKALSKWELSKENNMLARANYIYDDTLRSYQKLKCNEEGDIIETSTFRAAADTLISSRAIKGNAEGDTVIYEFFDYKGELTFRTLVLYNDLKQFIGYQAYNKDGNYSSGNELKYNDHGISAEVTFYNKDKEASSVNYFTYEYDKMGNWVKVICKDQKGFVIIGERVYTYFE